MRRMVTTVIEFNNICFHTQLEKDMSTFRPLIKNKALLEVLLNKLMLGKCPLHWPKSHSELDARWITEMSISASWYSIVDLPELDSNWEETVSIL